MGHTIIKISVPEERKYSGDVVFFHGLGGDPKNTWTSNGCNTFWPEWLGEDFPSLGIWSVGYEVAPSAWKGTAMPLVDRALNILDLLQAYQIGNKPVIFIAHSMGGLLVKQMLRHSCDLSEQYKEYTKQTKGVIFFSTPHTGSNLANFFKYAKTILRPTIAIHELESHNPQLRNLNTWYQNHVSQSTIKNKIYFETQSTNGFVIVDPSSSDPSIIGASAIPFDSNHTGICKIDNRDDQRYQQVKLFLAELFEVSNSTIKIEIVIDIPKKDFDPKSKRMLLHSIAGFLEIPPESIKITDEKEGSMKITTDIPKESGIKLLYAFRKEDPALKAALSQFPILNIRSKDSPWPKVIETITISDYILSEAPVPQGIEFKGSIVRKKFID